MNLKAQAGSSKCEQLSTCKIKGILFLCEIEITYSMQIFNML